MAIISFGRIDKKLLIVLILILFQLTTLIIDQKVDGTYVEAEGTFCSLEEEIGPIFGGIILMFIFRNKEKKNVENKKSFKYIIILFVLRVVKSAYEKLYRVFIHGDEYRYNTILNTINGVEMLLMTLGTFVLLKYKYYIHHMISMFAYCALGITCDFIYSNFFKISYDYVYIYIIYLINEVMVYCYLKYMMDKLYYHYIEIQLYWGVIGVIIKLIIFIFISIRQYKLNEDGGILHDIYEYFTNTNVAVIIFYQFLYYITTGAIEFLLITLMLYYLKPNHYIITDEFYVYIKLIFFEKPENRFYTLIPFCFQILFLLFYFEIFEFNFWGLNKNTVKNIQQREGNDVDSRYSKTSNIELEEQYYLEKNGTRTSDEGKTDKLEQTTTLIETKNFDIDKDLKYEFDLLNNNDNNNINSEE